MQMINMVILLLTTSGCVTPLGISNKQKCSIDDLSLDSTSYGDSQGSGLIFHNNNTIVTSRSNSSKDVSCRKPQSKEEKCEVGAYKKSLNLLSDWNANTTTKNLFVGIGYAYCVIPGVVMYYYYDFKKDSFVNKINAQLQRDLKSCIHNHKE